MDLVHRILQVFERHRLWDEGVELIGSWCFLLYQRHPRPAALLLSHQSPPRWGRRLMLSHAGIR